MPKTNSAWQRFKLWVKTTQKWVRAGFTPATDLPSAALLTNNRREKAEQIVEMLQNQQIEQLFFYTDSNNLLHILKSGIQPLQQLQLADNESYTVWNYSQKPAFLELELSNTNRYHFWQWCLEQTIDPKHISIICLDLYKLLELTRHDWNYNPHLNHVLIYDPIPIQAIRWILVQTRPLYQLLKQEVISANLDLKIFYGQKNNLIMKG